MTDAENPYEPNPRGYERAVLADRRLRAIDGLVSSLCLLVRSDDTLCHSCVWESMVQPLLTPLVGHERGYLPDVAKDPGDDWKPMTAKELSELPDGPRAEATTETERWMRTSDAWDAVTQTLLSRLWDADPGNGHGVARAT